MLGQVAVRGPSVMLGYLHDQAATERAIDAGGWLRTGDAGHLDARGCLWVEGRADGVVKVAGERVGLDEIAQRLRDTPGVRELVMAALADQTLGHRLVGVLEVEPGQGESAVAAVRKRAREELPPHKRPHTLVVVEHLPRTPHGKIDQAALQRLAQEGA